MTPAPKPRTVNKSKSKFEVWGLRKHSLSEFQTGNCARKHDYCWLEKGKITEGSDKENERQRDPNLKKRFVYCSQGELES